MSLDYLQNIFANIGNMPQGVVAWTSIICKTHLEIIVSCYKELMHELQLFAKHIRKQYQHAMES